MSIVLDDDIDNFEEGSQIGQTFDFAKVLFVIKKSTGYFLLITLLCGLTVFLYLRYTKPLYKASSVLKLEIKSSSSSLFNIDLQGFNAGLDVQLQGELELLKSRKIYEGVLDEIDMSISYFAAGEILDDERFPFGPFIVRGRLQNSRFYGTKFFISIIDENSFTLSYEKDAQQLTNTYRFGEVIKNADLDIFIEKSPAFEVDQNEYYFKFRTKEELIGKLNSNLEITIINPTANTIGISYTDYNRHKAERIVNAVNSTYLTKTKEQKNQTYEQSLAFLEEQINRTRDTLEYYEKELSLAKPNLPDEENRFTDKVSLASEINRVQKEKLQLLEEIKSIEFVEKMILSDTVSWDFIAYAANVIGNSEFANEIKKIQEYELEIKRIEKSYESSVKKEYLLESIGKGKDKLTSRIAFNLKYLREKAKGIDNELYKLRAKFSGNSDAIINENDLELKKLNRYYSSYEGMYQLVLGKRIEIGVAKASTVPNFQILAKASASPVPISPVRIYAYIAGIVVAFSLSVLVVVIKYLLQNKINNLKELSNRLTVPVLGVVPEYRKEKMAHSQLIVHKNSKSSMSEAMRSIRTNLEFLRTGIGQKDKKTISITSTISGEGKTFVALNLAGIIAMADTKVVLLDLDLRKPKIHFGFGVDNHKGVTSVLIGQASIEECLHNSAIDNLKFITAGPLPPNPSEMIMSEAFEEMLSKLKQQFDVIIFDTPPVGLVTDGIIAMRHAAHKLYVLRAEYSKLSFTENVNHITKRHNLKNVGAILNAVNTHNTYGYGYDSYGYGYDYGFGASYGSGYGYYEEDEGEQDSKSNLWKKKLFFWKK